MSVYDEAFNNIKTKLSNDIVVLPREEAQKIANTLRSLAPVSGGLSSGRVLRDYADLLDPPQPSLRSLRDEMVAAHTEVMYSDQGKSHIRERAMDAALTVLMSHIMVLDYARNRGTDDEWVRLSDVISLLGDSNDEPDDLMPWEDATWD